MSDTTGNRKAFLDMIAASELGPDLIALSDDGYNVIVGSTPESPDLFDSYADHPRKRVWLSKIRNFSTAAGRYQILARYFDAYKGMLGLDDFSPDSQDAIALQMLKEVRALDDIDAGNIADAVHKAASRWASFPGAGYDQHENQMTTLLQAFENSGGTLA